MPLRSKRKDLAHPQGRKIDFTHLSLSEENFERVNFTRGNITLWHDAFLERISRDNPTYLGLIRQSIDIKAALGKVSVEEKFLSDDAWLQQQLELPVVVTGGADQEETLRFPTLAEIEARHAELVEARGQIHAQAMATREAQVRNEAERLAYLTKEWDITDQGNPVPCTAENILKIYPVQLLEIALEAVEGRAFGPLGTGKISGPS